MSDILQELLTLAGIPVTENEEHHSLNTNSLGENIVLDNDYNILSQFWNWFGNSKVADVHGRPLVVYHGGKKGINDFDINKISKDLKYGEGFYFTDDKREANFMKNTFGGDGGLYAVYLKIENPLCNPFEFKEIQEECNSKSHKIAEEIRRRGYDGVILDFEYVVFKPNQIKSVDNKGEFSPTNSNIYEAVEMKDIEEAAAYAGSRRNYDTPSLDAIGSGEGEQAHGWGLYYALNPDIAEIYRKTFTENPYENVWELLGEDLTEFLGDLLNNETRYMLEKVFDKEQTPDTSSARDNLLIALYDVYQFYATRYRNQHSQKDKELAEEALKKRDYVASLRQDDFLVGVGVVHKVEIPDLKFLMDEKEKIGQQSDYVQQRLLQILKELNVVNVRDYLGLSGKEFYNNLSNKLGSPKKASFLLHKYGIKGIHYFGEQDGECVVIFNPEDLRVLKKFYGGNGIEMEQIGG